MGNQSSRKVGGESISAHHMSSSHAHASSHHVRRGWDTSALTGSTHLSQLQQAMHSSKTSVGAAPAGVAAAGSASMTATTPPHQNNPAAAGVGGGSPSQQQQQQPSSGHGTQDDSALDGHQAAAMMSRSMQVYPYDDDNAPYTTQRKRSNTLDIVGMRGINSGIDIPTGTNRRGVLPTVVRWKGGGKNVFIAGSFNNWKAKIPMVKSQNDFMTIIELPEGKHDYKFWVDGQWVHDPTANAVVNQYGSKNNYIDVKKSDFEVFEALEKDSEKAPKKEHNESFQTGSPPDSEYSQEIASRRIYDQTSGPPILPPHLRDVILNQNLPVDYEPNLLPEPTHVMLNHMYALSIKDGVMVLSTTHRYRKKYVTTLLYKPIS